MKSVLKKTLLGLAAAAVLAECALQLAGLIFPSRFIGNKLQSVKKGDDVIRVLCLGDSVTQGVGADHPKTESYPARLEEMLKERFPSKEIQVINLGMWGINSSQLLNSTPRFLRAVKPDEVLLMIGINDPWNLEENLISRRVPFPAGARVLFTLRKALFKIKLYKLYQSFRFFDVQKRLGDMAARNPDFFAQRTRQIGRDAYGGKNRGLLRLELENNISAIVALARERNIGIIVMVYPKEGYGEPNALLRAIYKKFDVPVIDLSAGFLDEDGSVRQELFIDDDFHPTSEGYNIVAETVLPVVSRMIE